MFAKGERDSRPEGAYRAEGISHAQRISQIRKDLYRKISRRFMRRLILQLLGLLLASLVSNAARGLASGLAGSLALAASAVLNGSLEVTGIDSTNSLHCKNPPFGYNLIHHIVYMIFDDLSRGFDDFWRNPRIFQHFEVIFYLLGDALAGQKERNSRGIDPKV